MDNICIVSQVRKFSLFLMLLSLSQCQGRSVSPIGNGGDYPSALSATDGPNLAVPLLQQDVPEVTKKGLGTGGSGQSDEVRSDFSDRPATVDIIAGEDSSAFVSDEALVNSSAPLQTAGHFGPIGVPDKECKLSTVECQRAFRVDRIPGVTTCLQRRAPVTFYFPKVGKILLRSAMSTRSEVVSG